MDETARRYALVGIACTLASYLALFVAIRIFGLAEFPANASAFVVGLGLSYALNAKYSFRYAGPLRRGLARFAVAFLIAYTVNLVVLFALVSGLEVSSLPAQFCAFTAFTLVFYVLNRYWAFAFRNP